MDYSFLDFLTLTGSLGMFLYGMKTMSEGLQKVAGDKLRSILSVMTTSRIAGVLTGVLITALVQSSSATTVMVVSFVNAGLLSLAQSISVIMGANVGTTMTAWIISLFGFKVDISILSLPIIGICIPLLFSKKSNRKSWGEFLIGFAFLFLGLSFLKSAVPDLRNNPEILSFIQNYTSMGYGSIFLFMFIGTLLTIVVQSSSATVAITLIMCTKGWIPFEIAAAMVLGENIGTTITANIAAISANISARRAALAHLIFNIFGVCWMLAIFFPFTNMVSWLVTNFGPGDPTQMFSYINTLDTQTVNLVTSGEDFTDSRLTGIQEKIMSLQVSVSFALSLFHTMFNIINILIMIGFVNIYVRICSSLIKSDSDGEEDFNLKFISANMLSTSELSLIQAKKEIALYGERIYRMLDMVKELLYEKDLNRFLKIYARIEKYEQISDRVEIEIANYLTKVLEGRLSAHGKEDIRIMLRVISEIESIADSCYNLARNIKRRNDDKIRFTEEQERSTDHIIELVDKALIHMNKVLRKEDVTHTDSDISYNIENEINTYRDQIKNDNIENINTRKYSYSNGVYFMDMISECEKLGDYILNVIQTAVEKRF